MVISNMKSKYGKNNPTNGYTSDKQNNPTNGYTIESLLLNLHELTRQIGFK